MMQDDDEQVGRVLSRREALRVLGLTGAAALAACSPARRGVARSTPGGAPAATSGATATATAATSAAPSAAAPAATAPSCVVRPALTEGPFFVDEKLNRSDIRSDPADGSLSPGLPLVLHFTVSKISGGACTSLEGAVVDVWHCDAEGRYSDEQQNRTLGKKFLRGYQTTDANGTASFTTIYPGWYTGRAVHIHFKIRTGSHDFTSQLFFDDALSDEVYTKAPYTGRGSRDRDMRNSDDGIYRQSRGQLLLEATREGNGLASRFGIALQL